MPSAVDRALTVLAFAATLALTSVGLQLGLSPRLPMLSAKLDWLAAPPDHTVIAIGTSRVYRSFIPEVFDAEVSRRAGVSVRSFNLGVSALSLAEVDLLIRQLPSGPGPRWVLLDAHLADKPGEGQEYTRRAIAWHTAEQTWLACLNPVDVGPWARIEATATHLHAFALRQFWSGTAAEAIRRAWSRDFPARMPEDEDHDYVVEHEGYGSEAAALAASGAARPRPLKGDPPEARRPGNPKRDTIPTSPYREAMYARILGRLEHLGWTPILLRTPNLPRPPLPGGATSAGVPLINLADRQAYPELFENSGRADNEHLNDTGARLATLAAAAAFVEGAPLVVH